MYKRFALNGLAMIGLLAGASAYAEQAPGFYVGAGIGDATVEVDDVDFDASDTAFKVFGGYSFNQYFAVELTYFDGGSPSEDFSEFGVNGSVEAEIDGLNASMVGRIPVGDSFSLFGKLGFASYDVTATARAGNVSASEDGSDEDISYGIGAAMGFGQFEVRAEYEAIDVSGGNFSVLSVSGLYRF
jgi:Outer membrane protein beta-barrel domain